MTKKSKETNQKITVEILERQAVNFSNENKCETDVCKSPDVSNLKLRFREALDKGSSFLPKETVEVFTFIHMMKSLDKNFTPPEDWEDPRSPVVLGVEVDSFNFLMRWPYVSIEPEIRDGSLVLRVRSPDPGSLQAILSQSSSLTNVEKRSNFKREITPKSVSLTSDGSLEWCF